MSYHLLQIFNLKLVNMVQHQLLVMKTKVNLQQQKTSIRNRNICWTLC